MKRHMILPWEQRLTNRITVWGKEHYRLWYVFAVHTSNVYAVAWVIFALLGWLSWWTIPAIAITAWLITISLQAMIRRERPKFEETTGYRMWWRTYALPSGHTTITSALATVILLETHFPHPIILGIVAVIFVITQLLIGVGRIVVGVHYVGDIVAGFVFGIAFGVLYSSL